MKLTYATAPIPPGPQGTKRQREREAVAQLAARLVAPGAVVSHDAAGAPFLPDYPDVRISVSHSAQRAALAVSDSPVGIDVEESSPRIDRVIGRVTTTGDDLSLPALTLWTVKEAVFKASMIPDLTIGEIAVSADGSASARGRLFSWSNPEPGVAIATPVSLD